MTLLFAVAGLVAVVSVRLLLVSIVLDRTLDGNFRIREHLLGFVLACRGWSSWQRRCEQNAAKHVRTQVWGMTKCRRLLK